MRWVLGFDGGCTSCADMANKIQREVGDAIEVRSLRDKQVHEWIHQAHGEKRPRFAPTLLRVSNNGVRSWTGTRMSIKLATLLGPRRSVAILRQLDRAPAVSNPERRSLIAGIPGVALGAFVLSGGTAFAAQKEKEELREIEGKEARRLQERAESDPHFAILVDHLYQEGYETGQWHAMEHIKNNSRYSTSVSLTMVLGDREAVVSTGAKIADDSWSTMALVTHDQDRYALVVLDDRVERITRDDPSIRAQAPSNCYDICHAICFGGSCGLSCVVICAGVCLGSPACAIACSPICAAVCDYHGPGDCPFICRGIC